tara:strand:+ start:16409 stop:17125 length:717 start_codon:yes stop_codon:yes gene_type:complete
MINFYLYYTIGRKVLMALSGFFLMFFLFQHLAINLTSIFPDNGKTFNSISHFMGTNAIVQFILQPILIFGFMFHLLMGMILDFQNKKSTQVKYSYNKNANSTWMSRNMIITGVMIFLFLILHFIDFWIPEITIKYIEGDRSGFHQGTNDYRYFYDIRLKFVHLWRVILYVLSFIFLSLHLLHGFQSAFQSVGFRSTKYTPIIKKISYAYGVLIPLGFIVVAIYHYIYNLVHPLSSIVH